MFDKRAHLFFGPNSSSEISIDFTNSQHDKRFYILLIATSSTGIKLGRDWLYDRAIRPNSLHKIVPDMVKRVSDDLISEIGHGGCADEYMRDQLVVFQALAEGRSEVFGGKREDSALAQPSLHAKTGMWVAKEVLGVEFDDKGSCTGIGFAKNKKEEEEKTVDDVIASMQELAVSS